MDNMMKRLLSLTILSASCALHSMKPPLKPHLKKPCSLTTHDTKVILTARKDGIEKSIELDLPKRVTLGPILHVSCQNKRIVIITGDYGLRTLGIDPIIDGQQMLGEIQGQIFAQNTMVIPFYEGTVISATVTGSMVEIKTERGERFFINIDAPFGSGPKNVQIEK